MKKTESEADTNIAHNIQQTCIQVFGFLPDPTKTKYLNRNIVAGTLTPQALIVRPTHTAFHNLCENTPIPPGTASLLGQGLNFCIETPCQFQNIENGHKRFAKSVRLHDWFMLHPPKDTHDYIPALYIPSEWNPPQAHDRLGHYLSTFTNKLDLLYSAIPRTKRFNLSKN